MLKIAFATSDGRAVDQHFGWCQRFDIYDVTAEDAHLIDVRVLMSIPDDESDKIESRLDKVRDCAILHICDIGGSAAARVVNAQIFPVKVPEDTSIDVLITRLQGVLAGNPPPWLRKVLRAHDAAPAWTPGGVG
ncbi:MAG TPA: nitrogen fixation protein NifX [Pseudonocardiaceae bacterium]